MCVALHAGVESLWCVCLCLLWLCSHHCLGLCHVTGLPLRQRQLRKDPNHVNEPRSGRRPWHARPLTTPPALAWHETYSWEGRLARRRPTPAGPATPRSQVAALDTSRGRSLLQAKDTISARGRHGWKREAQRKHGIGLPRACHCA